jgi:CBS-domain-containing membrane protein
VTTTLFSSNILLSNTSSLCSSLHVRNQVSHQYEEKLQGNLQSCQFKCLPFLDGRKEDRNFKTKWDSSKKKQRKTKKMLLLESASELYRPSDCHLSLVPTFADRGCQVVSVTDPCGSILGFLDWNNPNMDSLNQYIFANPD